MFRAGMASILSELARQDRLVVVDALEVAAPKTKLFSQKIKAIKKHFRKKVFFLFGISTNIIF